MNKNVIVKAHNAGLFSLLNNVISCLDKYGELEAIDWTNTIYSKDDLWPVLFEPFHPIRSMALVGDSAPEPEAKTVEGYEDQWLTYKNAGVLYQGDQEWRVRCNSYWQYLKVRRDITANVARFPMLSQFRGKTVAALIRANTHAGEQLSGKSQTPEEYAEAIAAEEPDHLYIACQDAPTLGWIIGKFSSSYGVGLWYHRFAKRSISRDIDRHLTEPQTPRDAIVVLEEALIMSQCDVLIHPISNIATAVLYMNPAIKSVFLP